jgi:predicted PhzF superfamily epimerase YddE/YHI9
VTRPVFQVDAFCAEPFAGNPAAVCLLEAGSLPRGAQGPDPGWMQRVAAEMNLSETAFLLPGDGPGDTIWLDFPATPAEPVDPPAGLVEALGAGTPRWVGRGRFDYLVELEDEAAVRGLRPGLRRLGQLEPGSVGVIVTAPAAAPGGYDFVSRYFAPAAGIDEDPVTGSAHCTLGPFWAGRLGRDQLTGFQASARGGLVEVRPEGDRVQLGGRAVTVLRGQLV